MRNKEEAVKCYMAIYKTLTRRQKRKLGCFEGQKFFRFGNSWRRLSSDEYKLKTAILNDDEEKILLVGKGAKKEILCQKDK